MDIDAGQHGDADGIRVATPSSPRNPLPATRCGGDGLHLWRPSSRPSPARTRCRCVRRRLRHQVPPRHPRGCLARCLSVLFFLLADVLVGGCPDNSFLPLRREGGLTLLHREASCYPLGERDGTSCASVCVIGAVRQNRLLLSKCHPEHREGSEHMNVDVYRFFALLRMTRHYHKIINQKITYYHEETFLYGSRGDVPARLLQQSFGA